jgi:hypothetical protein
MSGNPAKPIIFGANFSKTHLLFGGKVCRLGAFDF